jgi:hypothetical protein
MARGVRTIEDQAGNQVMTMKISITSLIAGVLTAATHAQDEVEVWARLPEPVTNNAVAGAELDGRMMAYSFAGLHEGKTWRDVTADAYACDLEARTCREMDGLPDGIGRLASVAVNVGGQIYIFGGYTVAEDGSERSTPEVWRFDPATETYTHITNMPGPVDDTVALPFQDRYIYLVSGWHDTDNVDLVQVYDVEEGRWFEATPFPGAPVFGHAGAMNYWGRLLVCGGTAVFPPDEEGGRRSFAAIDACWTGQIGDGVTDIVWSDHTPVPSGPVYRGALIASGRGFYLVGGTDNAFNYNGIGYNAVPSEPRQSLARASWCGYNSWWIPRSNAPAYRMDIRGLVMQDDAVFVLGGMDDDQAVSDMVLRYDGRHLADIEVPCLPD